LFQTRTCFFHFLKALRKHLGDCNILALLATNSRFASFVHLVYSLPYVPTSHVVEVYEDVILKSLDTLKKSRHPDIIANVSNIDKWVVYLEHTWIGKRKENSEPAAGEEDGRTSGLYPLQKWNQHEAALHMWPRTNNSSEGNLFFVSKKVYFFYIDLHRIRYTIFLMLS
jgi:hypothetical protein